AAPAGRALARAAAGPERPGRPGPRQDDLVSGGRLLWVAVLAAVYLLTLGSADPFDPAFGVGLAGGLSFGLGGRLERPQGEGPALAARLAAAPVLLAALLAAIARGTWDV